MHTMTINTAGQLVTDRRTAYEGVAARRRLRSLFLRGAHEAAVEVRAVRPVPLVIVTSRKNARAAVAARKVA